MDKKMQEWKSISLTGRLCYLFMCIERYLVFCYPDRDWTPVARKMWVWTEGYWDEGLERYQHVVPEFLLEFDNYKETNEREFDGELSEQDYNTLVKLYEGITNGSEEDEIDEVLMLPVDFNNFCEGTSFSWSDKPTIELIGKAQNILLRNGIDIPSIDMVSSFTIRQQEWGDLLDERLSHLIRMGLISDKDEWGGNVDSTYLSIILKN